MTSPLVPLSGRRAQAARNDEAILSAAREVFVNDPSARVESADPQHDLCAGRRQCACRLYT